MSTSIPPFEAAAGPSTRDPRYDFIRGLTLLIIVYDHIIGLGLKGHPVWLEITPYFWGFASAPTIFVFISGLVYGLVYGKVFDKKGLGAVSIKSMRRTGSLYLAHVAVFAVVYLIMTCLPDRTAAVGEGKAWAAANGIAGHDHLTFVIHYLRLAVFPDCLDILPLYMLMVLAGPVMLVGLARAPMLTLGVSAMLWLLVQFGVTLPYAWLRMEPMHYEPLAWQFVFLGGMAMPRLKPVVPRSPRLTVVSGAALGLMAIYVWGSHFAASKGFSLEKLGWAIDPAWSDVTHLHYIRLLYLIVGAYFLSQVIPAPTNRRFWNTPLVALLKLIGSHSLPCYCFGVCYIWLVVPLLALNPFFWPAACLMALLGFVLTALLAIWLSRFESKSKTGSGMMTGLPQLPYLQVQECPEITEQR